MIPKKIHYCWFGKGKMPELALKCIASWKKHLPNYEIKEWNEDNFDVNIIPYTEEAYKAKKYAFVSDYARFWILYKYGGLYFDTDVEVIRPMDDIIARGAFMGCERGAKESGATVPAVAPGLGLGVNPGLGLYKEILDLYSTLHFMSKKGDLNLKTVVEYTTELLCKYGLRNTREIQQVADVWIYPKEYFNPMEHVNDIRITPNTYSIHHYAGTWITKKMKMKKKLLMIVGKRNWSILKFVLGKRT
ncbi:MAG: glycosyltransferase [Bacteroidaceae bacterium]